MSSNQTAATVRSALTPFSSHAARLSLGVRALNSAAATVLLGAGGFLAASAHWPALAYVYLAVLVAGSALSLRFEFPVVDRAVAGRDALQLWFIVAGVMSLTAVLTLALPHGFAAVLIAIGMGLALRVRQAISHEWVEEFFSVYSVRHFNLVSRVLGVVLALVALLVVAIIGVLATYEFTQAAAQLGGIMVLLLLSGQCLCALLLNRRRAELLTVPLDRSVADFVAEPELTWSQVASAWARPWLDPVRDVALAGLFVVTLVTMAPVVAHHAGGPAALLVVTGLVVAGVVLGWCLPARAGVPALQGSVQRGVLLLAVGSAVVMFFAPWLIVVAVSGSLAGLLGGYVLNSALIPSNVSYLAQSVVKVAEVAAIAVLLLAAGFATVIGQSPTVGAQVEIVIIVLLVAAAMAVPFLLGWKQKQTANKDNGGAPEASGNRAANSAAPVAKSTVAAPATVTVSGTRTAHNSEQATAPLASPAAVASVDQDAETVLLAAKEPVGDGASLKPTDSIVPTGTTTATEPDDSDNAELSAAALSNLQETSPQMNPVSPEPEPELNRPDLRDGAFIVVEGGDGAGKSTVLAALANALEEITDQRIVVTREPGGTAAGRRLRDLLLGNIDWSARAEALLFAADRAQHVTSVIEPTLADHDIVLSDRYVDSSIAYQGAGRALDPNEIESLSRWATNDLSPHLTILLDVDPEIAVGRRAQDATRGADDRMESEALEFHVSVREFFLALAEREPERYVVLDANQPQDQVVAAAVAGMVQFFAVHSDAQPDAAVVIDPAEAVEETEALSDARWLTEPVDLATGSPRVHQVAWSNDDVVEAGSKNPESTEVETTVAADSAPVNAATDESEPELAPKVAAEPASAAAERPDESASRVAPETDRAVAPNSAGEAIADANADVSAVPEEPAAALEEPTEPMSPMAIADKIVTGGQKITPADTTSPKPTAASSSDADADDDLALLWLADAQRPAHQIAQSPSVPAAQTDGGSWFDTDSSAATATEVPRDGAQTSAPKSAESDSKRLSVPTELLEEPVSVADPAVNVAEPHLVVAAEPEPEPELVSDLGPEPIAEPITELLHHVPTEVAEPGPTEVLVAAPKPTNSAPVSPELTDSEPTNSEPSTSEPTNSELLQEIVRTKPVPVEPDEQPKPGGPITPDNGSTRRRDAGSPAPEPKPAATPRTATTPEVTAIPTRTTPAVPAAPPAAPTSPTNRVRIAAPQTTTTAEPNDQNVEIFGPDGVKWEAKTVPLSKYGNTASQPVTRPATTTQTPAPQTISADQLIGTAALPQDHKTAAVPTAQPQEPPTNQASPGSATLPIATEYMQPGSAEVHTQGHPSTETTPVAPTRTHVFNPNNFAAAAPEPTPATPTRRARRRQRAIDLRDTAATSGSTPTPPVAPPAPTETNDPHSRSSQRRRRFAQAERERRERADQHYQDWFFEGDYGDNRN